MRRELANVERLTIPRHAPLVPCAFTGSKEDRWQRRSATCGALIPYKPNKPCPECGAVQMRAQPPEPGPDSRVITRDTAIIDGETGEVVVVYVNAARQMASRLMYALREVVWDKDVYWSVSTTTRLSGMAVTHRTYGYQPPQPIRRRYGCSRSQFNSEHPEAMAVLSEFCTLAEHVFRTHAEDVYERTTQAVFERIAQPWRIAGTPWTSGIINQTAALPYHVDKGNIRGSWSAMLACRHNVGGGMLHLADYNTYLEIGHGSITIFDGQSVCHGVTPLVVTGVNAQRITTVTYAKSGLSKCCADPAQEAKRAAMETTAAEDRRLAGYRPVRGGRR